ncbi:amino acid adenylation domain-containing protein [Streptomyces sp. NBC_00237]|uniref:non-ribosomal peptide synthetase n=1 Tax=Streptomyces sp. NBC_00237 TaxID=2975687 RepID=UPI0022581E00|nr:non-ribosomal peptide synthetase [Streptomyces sp. NBC_00237]MCX5205599.1 amino acid adenylation domain-containing protein [Streptomyces sp. NBC_00237]
MSSHGIYGPFEPVVEALLRRAGRQPERVAVRQGPEHLTYGELADRVRAEAGRIGRAVEGSAGPEPVVAVALPRGIDLVVTLLGTLHSGAVFLPVDPELPGERAGRMLSAADLLVTGGAHRTLAERSGLPLLPPAPRGGVLQPVSAAQEGPVRQPVAGGPDPWSADHDRGRPVHREQGAYVLFTSGSTGTPKAVCVPHGALANHTASVSAAYGLRPDDRVLQLASAGFDVALEEILPTLAVGAELVLAPPVVLSPEDLSSLLAAERVTVANLATPYWQHWVRDLTDGRAPVSDHLRLLVVGSDTGRASTLADWRRFSDAAVVNAYGLTEATITSTVHRFPAEEPSPPYAEQDGAVLPVGRPLGGVGVRLLGQDLRPVLAGETGEIFVSGAGLARGYLEDPALTAERFVPDPLADPPGARLYRTGDLGRWDGQGALYVLGRADELVKIRGQRVHPREADRHLTAHPQVAAAHTLAPRTGPSDTTELIAFVVPADERAVPTAGQLRDHLATQLPPAHVPTRYVIVDALPLRTNGKVDTEALPLPSGWQRDTHSPRRPPATDTEEALAAVWCEVLEVTDLGTDDSFLDLGGHSLAVARMANRITERFGVRLPVSALMAAPTIAEQAALLTAPERAGLSAPLPPLVRAAPDADVPLTAQQRQVWFLQKLSPGNVAYHAQTTLRVIGALDTDALGRAVATLTARHAIFRTTFHDDDGTPRQRTHATGPMPVELVDLTALPAGEQRARVEEITAERARTPFALDELPLLRWTVVRLGPLQHEIVLVEHHLVHDGWSFGLLMQELRACYAAEVTGEPADLPALPFQYADYALWQHTSLTSDAFLAQRDHWAGVLADAPAPTTLPTLTPRRGKQTFRGGAVRVEVPTGTVTALRRLARQEGATLFATMLAGFYAVLGRCTGEEDLVIGSGFANRQMAQTEQLIGMLVNPVVLRCDIGGNPAFTTLVHRTRDTVLTASAHQEYPFLELVRHLNPDRDPTANPYFQLMFSSNDARLPDLELPGASATVFERDNGSAKADLNVIMIPRAEAEKGADGRVDGRVTLLWEYNADLFDPGFMAELVESYLGLLSDAARHPDRRLSDLALLSAERRKALLRAGRGQEAEPARPLALLIEDAVRRCPDAVAVLTADGEQVTYAELAVEAAAVAARLDEAGTGDEPVGLFLSRTPRMIAALLGVLLSGRSYLPLDPAHPPARTGFTLGDSGARCVLVDTRTAAQLPEGPWEAIDAGTAGYHPVGTAAVFPRPPARPEATAYVLYTSGSTGPPKGCLVSHRNLDHFVRWAMRDTPADAFSRTLATASICFDMSLYEILPTLASGGTVQLLDHLLDLPKLPPDEAPTQLCAVPSLLGDLLRDHRLPPGLLLVNLGGEAPPSALVSRLCAAGIPAVRNLYGPTEITVLATASAVTDPGQDHARPVPLGGPVPGAQVYVVDEWLNLMPPNCPGELVVGGDGVTAGYRGRPGLTAERFVPDVFSGVPNARLYRTGDRARWTTDGRLEFLGRLDDQVKIRGLRIELGEIDHVLADHPSVSAAWAVVTGEAPDQILTAYLQRSGEADPDPAELHAHASARLPSGLVPTAFVVLDEVPLTPTGKVDRSRLPLWGESADAPQSRTTSPPPATADALEEHVLRIWAEVLDQPELHRDSSFFAVGGHSLLMLRLRHRIAAELGAEVETSAFFDHPTVAEMTAHVRSLLSGGPDGPGAQG